MNCIDFHSHLDFDDFDGTREELIDEFFRSGGSKLVTVADPVEKTSYLKTDKILSINENIFCVSAIHPHHADHYSQVVEQKLLKFIKKSEIMGIGETGLDFFYNHSNPENQLRVFKRQIQIAKSHGKPLIIHSRNAEKEVLNTLEKESFDFPVVFHCYTGDMENALEILKRGYHISISGIITFKNADYLREIVQKIPMDRIFTETDSPFLSPEPFRGKTNNPLRVILVVEKIAEIKGTTVFELNKSINENFERLR